MLSIAIGPAEAEHGDLGGLELAPSGASVHGSNILN